MLVGRGRLESAIGRRTEQSCAVGQGPVRECIGEEDSAVMCWWEEAG